MGEGPPWGPVWEAYRVADTERGLALCDPEVEWETRWPGMDPVYRGVEGLRRWGELFQEVMQPAPLELIEARELDANRVLLWYRVTGRGTGSGVEVSREIRDLWTFRKGRLLRREVFYSEDELPEELR